jgi:hypothetical protein
MSTQGTFLPKVFFFPIDEVVLERKIKKYKGLQTTRATEGNGKSQRGNHERTIQTHKLGKRQQYEKKETRKMCNTDPMHSQLYVLGLRKRRPTEN